MEGSSSIFHKYIPGGGFDVFESSGVLARC
jgi:hypothetical protein